MRTNAFLKPAAESSRVEIMLQRPLSAVQVFQKEDGTARLGLFSKLGPGVAVEPCGEGFNDRTVKVRANGQCYFVFIEDLASQSPAAARTQSA